VKYPVVEEIAEKRCRGEGEERILSECLFYQVYHVRNLFVIKTVA
jgi:hypothetical protein